MIKKLISFCLLMVMGVMVLGCGPCGDNNNPSELDEYKAAAKTEIQEYASGKGEDNYSEQNWLIIQAHVTDGKQAIDSATTKADVDTAFNDAKSVIDAVENESETTKHSNSDERIAAQLENTLRQAFVKKTSRGVGLPAGRCLGAKVLWNIQR